MKTQNSISITPYNIPIITKTTASDRNTGFPSIFIPELAFVAVVEAAVPVPVLFALVVATPPLLVVVVLVPRIEVPEIDCKSAAAVTTKDAGVIVVVCEESNDSVTTADGNTEKAFPAVLDKGSVPGSPTGKLRGLYAVVPAYGKL